MAVATSLSALVEEVLAQNENIDVTMTRIAGRTYVTAKDLGFSLVSVEPDLVSCVQVYAEPDDDRLEGLSLPWGLLLSDSRAEVRSKLGSPQESGGGDRNPLTGKSIPPWDVFVVDGYRCHVEFRPDVDRAALVSIELARD